MELDHLFVLCDVAAPEAEALRQLGLLEGSSNLHPGQGTACRRFFFETSYLELTIDDGPSGQSRNLQPRLPLRFRW